MYLYYFILYNFKVFVLIGGRHVSMFKYKACKYETEAQDPPRGEVIGSCELPNAGARS